MNSRRNKRGGRGADNGPGSVRIIGGRWRGRRLPVADTPGLRPSGDRVRETLFNWPQPVIRGARCADLFAGTGALGFESASRGADEVTLIERSSRLAELLREAAEKLGAGQVAVVESDALEWLRRQPAQSLDLIFIDPPFDSGLAESALETLKETGCLAPGGLVYLESPRLERAGTSPRLDQTGVPEGYLQAREKVIGEVRMQLLERQAVG